MQPGGYLLRTWSVALAVWVSVPLVPEIESVSVPVGLELLVLTVMVDVEEAGFGLKVALAPEGSRLADSVTEPAKPFDGLTVIVYVTDLPLTTDWLEGDAEIVKSGDGGGGGDELNMAATSERMVGSVA